MVRGTRDTRPQKDIIFGFASDFYQGPVGQYPFKMDEVRKILGAIPPLYRENFPDTVKKQVEKILSDMGVVDTGEYSVHGAIRTYVGDELYFESAAVSIPRERIQDFSSKHTARINVSTASRCEQPIHDSYDGIDMYKAHGDLIEVLGTLVPTRQVGKCIIDGHEFVLIKDFLGLVTESSVPTFPIYNIDIGANVVKKGVGDLAWNIALFGEDLGSQSKEITAILKNPELIEQSGVRISSVTCGALDAKWENGSNTTTSYTLEEGIKLLESGMSS